MDAQIPQEPEIVTREEALENFRTALRKQEMPHAKELLEKQEILERYLFDKKGYTLWELVNSCRSVVNLSRVAVLHYGSGVLDEKPVKKADVKKELNQICESIDAFCEEGTARNEILMTLSHLLKKWLRDRYHLNIDPLINRNLLIELRAVIKDNTDAITEAVTKKGARPKKDLAGAYLLTVFEKVFPNEEPSRGDQSLCFNFILLALQSCAPDHHLSGLDKIRSKLGERIRSLMKEKLAWFEYSEEEDRVIPIKNLLKQIRDYPELAEMRRLN